jgi:hypothetical protein
MIGKCKLQAGNPLISGLLAFTIQKTVTLNSGNKTGTKGIVTEWLFVGFGEV